MHPIGFYSKILPPLKSWSASKLELRGTSESAKRFSEFLYGRFFKIYSDHKALESFNNFKRNTVRLSKSIDQLIDFDFKIIHMKNDSPPIKAVDHLSRYPVESISTISFNAS